MRVIIIMEITVIVLAAVSMAANTPPTVPVPLHPEDSSVVDVLQPTLVTQISTDADFDPISYFFVLYDKDSLLPSPIYGEYIGEQGDSVVWTVSEPLCENWIFFWKARAYDFVQYSDWSEERAVWINTDDDPPWTFKAIYPPDTGYSFIHDLTPEFWWERALEPDPFDSVFYTLYIATDSEFQTVVTYDSIWTTEYEIPFSLEFGKRYWWKVKATDNSGLFSYSWNTPDFRTWTPGDVNGDGMINIMDAVYIINYLYKGGPEPRIR